jgi:type VI secretion system protein ImpL
MTKTRFVLVTTGVISFTILLAVLNGSLRLFPGLRHANPYVIQTMLLVISAIGAAVMAWLMSKRVSNTPQAAAGAAAQEAADVESLIDEAKARLAEAQNEKDTKLGTLPAVFVIGESGSAKTNIMVRSGLEPELLAGQVYEENNIVPTPLGNVWFARGTVFVEAAKKLLTDAAQWTGLIDYLQPSKLASLMGRDEVPRAALVCVDSETVVTAGGEDALAASARNLRARLVEISQRLGINLPVYVLFTKTDRIPFFMEYFRNLDNEEAAKTFGMTLPIVTTRQGVYAEEENSRLGTAFERLFRGLCNARPGFMARDHEPVHRASVYEFPREFRKMRVPLVRFLVELCKPSQLTTGPFLRGFYFSGVRPVMVTEAAPAVRAPEPAAAGGRLGATGMFQMKAGAQPAAAPTRLSTRKVPQWMFLGHLFNDVLLSDEAAMGASASSVKASLPRRILLGTAAGLCLLYSGLLAWSFTNNRALETRVRQAAEGIASVESPGANVASLASLQRLETLRGSLETLTTYNRDGAPWSYRWGLYAGNSLYPEVRRVYFDDFRKLLLGQTQTTIVDSLRAVPGVITGGPEYGPTYDSLKAYLITTSNHDKSTRAFLAPVLTNRWSANRNIDPERQQLAQKQFEFYARELKVANPFSSDNDTAAVEKARHYLALFAGFERVYQAMLADAAKNTAPLNFNKRFPGSAEVVLDSQDVAGPFTKPGWEFIKNSLKNPQKYFSGEQWVLGDQSASNIDQSKLGQQLAERYYSDYIKQWRAYLKAASVVRYANLPDAAKKLNTLSGNQSPLLELFWLASQNTGVDVPAVANAFQPVHAVVPPTAVDHYIAPPNQAYMSALVTLQTSVDAAASMPQPTDAAAAQTLTNASAARVSARQVAQSFRIDPEGRVEVTVQKLMEDPITSVEALLRKLGPDELNGKGKAMCVPFRALMTKYPFNSNSTVQATAADVSSVFRKPDGALWKLYDENLQKLLPKQGALYVAMPGGAVTLNPAFVNFFNQAAALSDFFYGGGSQDPHFTYILKPVPTDGIQTVNLQLDGQQMSYSGGPAAAKNFVWQTTGAHEAKASVKFGETPLTWSNDEGLWAVFQFFGKAEQWRPAGTGNVLEWVLRLGKDPVLANGKPLTVRFELDMGGGPQVFQKGFLSRLGCVAEVAK